MQWGGRRYSSRVNSARQRQIIMLGCAAILIVLVIIMAVALRGCSPAPGDDTKAASVEVEQTEPPDDTSGGEPAPEESVVPEVTLSPLEAMHAPNSDTKLLQIVTRNKNAKKKIAISIDDCFDAENLKAILKLAKKYDAKLTFFPKGNTIEGNAEVWKSIYKAGHEIENHSFEHTTITKLDEAGLRAAIVDSQTALNKALGVNYHMRLFRCPTGAGMRSPLLHQILREEGYEGIASWGLSGAKTAKETLAKIQGGQIILFHAKASDLAKLKTVIPALKQRGYKMVTINELYGKEANYVTDLES